MPRLVLCSVIVVCLVAAALTGCGEDETVPTKVCIPSGRNHPPEVTIQNAYAKGVLWGEAVVLPITGSRDTIPAGAEVTFEWLGEDPDKCDEVTAYRYRMTGDKDYIWVGSDVTSVTYKNLPSGVLIFKIAAIDEKWAMTSPEVTRHFVSNFSPDTWYARQFVEKRDVDGAVVDIVHQEGDTVAVGSEVVLLCHAVDPDGDNEKLVYSHRMMVSRTCGGGSTPAFTFFDEKEPGPSYKCAVKISSDPLRTGFHKVQSRTMDELGRVDDTPAEICFYSNLAPVYGTADILVNGHPLSQTDALTTTGSIMVQVTSATDPDPGDRPASLETRCELEGLDFPYSVGTDWRPLGRDMEVGPISNPGRYKLTVRVKDYGCREGIVEREMVITVR
jgi:hypothetical protein